MPEFKFYCPQCGQHILGDDSHAGRQINCPVCQQAIVVPQAPAAGPIPPQPAPVPIPAPTPVAPPRPSPVPVTGTPRPMIPVAQRAGPMKSGVSKNILLIVVSVLVLAGVGAGGWLGFNQIKIYRLRGQLPSGLVALWSGEGNTRETLAGNVGIRMGTTAFEPGKVGLAFAFHGKNDLVTVGNPASLQLQDFTIVAWVKRSDASVVSYGSYGNGIIFGYGQGGYGLYLDPAGRPALSKIGIDETMPETTIADTAFHHLAVTKSGSTVVFYLDGQAWPAPAYNPGFVFSTVAAIGARGDNLDNSFFGLIDEVAVFNRALSAEEIQNLYAIQK
jgi:DNA-directed RNA polymerase subunit RPC12/RpoP